MHGRFELAGEQRCPNHAAGYSPAAKIHPPYADLRAVKKCSLQSILRFYASLLPCDVKTDNELLYELIPEFEKLCILKRGADGEIKLDIPALPFTEVTEYWNPACKAIRKELFNLLSDDLRKLWAKTRNCVPKHVDEAEYFVHAGAMRAYVTAQLLAIVRKELLPYPVVVGKTPLIYIAYRKKNM